MSALGSGSLTAAVDTVVERLILGPSSVQDVMIAAAGAAAGRGQSCGVTYRTRWGPVTVASSDARAGAVDEVEYAGGDGPCLQAMRTGEPVRMPDVEREVRWGSYPQHAFAAGVRSSVSYPLFIEGAPVGAVNLYSGQAGRWSREVDAAALVAVELVAGILREIYRMAAGLARDSVVIPTLGDAVIDLAVGMLVARDGSDAEHAEAVIRARAGRQNMAVTSVAQEIVDSAPPG
jgi:GAF domain-containing protein